MENVSDLVAAGVVDFAVNHSSETGLMLHSEVIGQTQALVNAVNELSVHASSIRPDMVVDAVAVSPGPGGDGFMIDTLFTNNPVHSSPTVSGVDVEPFKSNVNNFSDDYSGYAISGPHLCDDTGIVSYGEVRHVARNSIISLPF